MSSLGSSATTHPHLWLPRRVNAPALNNPLGLKAPVPLAGTQVPNTLLATISGLYLAMKSPSGHSVMRDGESLVAHQRTAHVHDPPAASQQ